MAILFHLVWFASLPHGLPGWGLALLCSSFATRGIRGSVVPTRLGLPDVVTDTGETPWLRDRRRCGDRASLRRKRASGIVLAAVRAADPRRGGKRSVRFGA